MTVYGIYYRKTPTFQVDEDLYKSDLTKGEFVLIGTFDFKNKDQIFGSMQAEFMLPTTKARIQKARETFNAPSLHTSMSVGDCIKNIKTGVISQCVDVGWKKVRY